MIDRQARASGDPIIRVPTTTQREGSMFHAASISDASQGNKSPYELRVGLMLVGGSVRHNNAR